MPTQARKALTTAPVRSAPEIATARLTEARKALLERVNDVEWVLNLIASVGDSVPAFLQVMRLLEQAAGGDPGRTKMLVETLEQAYQA